MSDISDAMGGAFDPQSETPRGDFEPIPVGWYTVEVDNASMEKTKAGTGMFLKLELSVLTEGFTGRKLFQRMNLVNPNPKAVEIGRRELAGLGQACGLVSITDSTELIGHKVMAHVKVRKDEGREPDNEVSGYKALDGAKTPAKTAPKGAQPLPDTEKRKPVDAVAKQTAAPSTGKRPWEL